MADSKTNSTNLDTEKTDETTLETKEQNQTYLYFDHKNIATLERFLNQFGQIENRYRSAHNREKPILRAKQQKRLSKAIKRARFLALIPFVGINKTPVVEQKPEDKANESDAQ